jgi:protein tyrosine phosphatase (PTP) superfamily phosphohydrolase (DUF442 family)
MLEDIYNFLPLTEGLLTSGMPTADQMKAVVEAGVEVVVNLAPFDSERDLEDEGALVESLGMKYIHIPIEWESPTLQNLQDFFRVMDENQNNRLLVHCRANYRATGFVTLYRIQRLGWPREQAFKDLHRIWNPDEVPVWKRFIEDCLSK